MNMPEPFGGGPSPSYPVPGCGSALPYPPQPSSMGYPVSVGAEICKQRNLVIMDMT